MSFTCFESFDYSKDTQFTHRIQIIQHKDTTNGSFVYVNLRTFEGSRPTDNGICLLMSEFEKLVPFMERKENMTLRDVRIVKFLKLDPLFYEIILIKPTHEFQVMIITEKELQEIVKMKSLVMKACHLQ